MHNMKPLIDVKAVADLGLHSQHSRWKNQTDDELSQNWRLAAERRLLQVVLHD